MMKAVLVLKDQENDPEEKKEAKVVHLPKTSFRDITTEHCYGLGYQENGDTQSWNRTPIGNGLTF
jgi:hypothetical protein